MAEEKQKFIENHKNDQRFEGIVKYLIEVRKLAFDQNPDYAIFRKLLENLNYGLINRLKIAFAHLQQRFYRDAK